MIEVARLTNARQQGDGNPSCLIKSKTTIANSLSKSDAALSAADARRHGTARGVARGGKSGVSRFVTQGRGDQRRQGNKLAGKDAGTRLVSIFVRGGRRGPLAGAGRPAARNPLRPGARAGRSRRLTAWGPTPALSAGVALRALHLTGSCRL